MAQKKLLGVLIIGYFEIIKGFFGLAMSYLLDMATFDQFLLITVLGVSVIKIIGGMGLLKHQAWARKLVLLYISMLIGLSIALLIVILWRWEIQLLIYGGLIIAVSFIFYLIRPVVRERMSL